MPPKPSEGGFSRKEAEEFRAMQDEMLRLARDYSRSRLAVLNTEMQQQKESWNNLSRDWQGILAQMAGTSSAGFAQMGAQGEATATRLGQSWGKVLGELTTEVEEWGEHFLQVMDRVSLSWNSALGGGGGGQDWLSWLGFGGWFHQGGIVSAHQGLALAPVPAGGDEQLVLAQAGEGILPRQSMARLGEKNFETLRRGQFEVASDTGPRYQINIQVQSLDAAGTASLNWERLVQRHILPLLEKEGGRCW